MDLVKIKNEVIKEVCTLLTEKTGITAKNFIDEDFLNAYSDEELDKPTKLFYRVALKDPFTRVLGGCNIYDLTFDIDLHLETKEENVTLSNLLLFLTDDKKIVKRYKDNDGKMKINIKNVSLLDSKNFTHLNETFSKEVITFDMLYEEMGE